MHGYKWQPHSREFRWHHFCSMRDHLLGWIQQVHAGQFDLVICFGLKLDTFDTRHFKLIAENTANMNASFREAASSSQEKIESDIGYIEARITLRYKQGSIPLKSFQSSGIVCAGVASVATYKGEKKTHFFLVCKSTCD